MIPAQGFGMVPPPYSEQNVYNNSYPSGYMQNPTAFNYDYNTVNPMMQGPQGSYPMYPNIIPPTGSEFQSQSWNNSVPPPAPVPVPGETTSTAQNPVVDEEKQRRDGEIGQSLLDFLCIYFYITLQLLLPKKRKISKKL